MTFSPWVDKSHDIICNYLMRSCSLFFFLWEIHFLCSYASSAGGILCYIECKFCFSLKFLQGSGTDSAMFLKNKYAVICIFGRIIPFCQCYYNALAFIWFGWWFVWFCFCLVAFFITQFWQYCVLKNIRSVDYFPQKWSVVHIFLT